MEFNLKWAVFAALVFGVFLTVSGDDDHGSLDFDLPDVERPKFANIPGLENLPINTSALPSPDEAEKIFKEKCLVNGGEDAYLRAKSARSEGEACVRSFVNYTELIEEMELAKPTGDLDTVFRKYCKKSPMLKGCIMDFITASNDCLSESERGSKQLVQNVTEQLLGFVCFKEGDRIARLMSKKVDISSRNHKGIIVLFVAAIEMSTMILWNHQELSGCSLDCDDVSVSESVLNRGQSQKGMRGLDSLVHVSKCNVTVFIAESGPECLSDKKEAIFHCINSTFGKHLPAGSPSIDTLPQLLLGADECRDVCALQHCVVKELEKCKEPTPANVIESMFNYVLKVTPCTKCRSGALSEASSSANSLLYFIPLSVITLLVSVSSQL